MTRETSRGAEVESPIPSSKTGSRATRLRQLDGLRGVAALVVLIGHLAIVVPEIAAPFYGLGRGATGSLEWWVNHTPLKLFTAGTEAVYIFFILSGLVVTLPYFSGKSWSWAAYYPRRIIRLYVPTLVAIVAAIALASVVRAPDPASSPWLQAQSAQATPVEILRDVTLVAGQFRINNPLWSLRWEIIFSIALPIYAALVILTRKIWPIVLGTTLVAIVALIAFQKDDYAYLLMFAVGMIFASQFSRLHGFAARLSERRWGDAAWTGLFALSIFSLISFWLFWPDDLVGTPAHFVLRGLAAVGAALLVLVVCFWARVVPFLTSRVVQWLGTISFSLYLIHVPVVATVAFALRDSPLWVTLVVGFVAALAAGQLFYWVIERPSHRLATATGKRILARRSARPRVPEATSS